ncbi:MAG: type II secretion system protein GspK [Kiritimatiellae bacterium]|jgi:hypothetical protein|nr:type II secretion system protein GspK [Kiritimatiellia bacterium]
MKHFSNTAPFPFRKSSAPATAGESGVILAIVLILLGVITALVLHAQALAYAHLNLENRRLLRAQLRKTAGDEVWRALAVLAADRDLLADHTNESWAAPMRLSLPNGIETETIIIDENRFIDANVPGYVSPAEQGRAPAAIVRDLLAGKKHPADSRPAFSPEIQSEIIKDWTDRDAEGNYEQRYYLLRQSEFYPANLPMASREELIWLLDAATNRAAGPDNLAVLPAGEARLEPVNINTADRRTLLAIFGENNAGQVETIIRRRDAAPLLALDAALDAEMLRKFSAYLSVRSFFFSVYAKAGVSASAEAVYCLAKRDQSGNIQVLRWVEQ